MPHETETEAPHTPNAAEEMFPPVHGGDVQSNADTIRALREGVEVHRRLAAVVLGDAFGDAHRLPLAVTTNPGGVTSVVVLRDALEIVDARAGGPRRRSGTVEIADLGSLIAYVKRYAYDDRAVAFAEGDDDEGDPRLTVIFDYDQASAKRPGDHPLAGLREEGVTGWRRDRAVYACPLSREWKAWTGKDGVPFSQTAFGDFIEKHAEEIHTHDGAGATGTQMLDMARKLMIHDKGTIKREVNPTTGTGTLHVSTEHDTTSTVIHPKFFLAIPVFAGSPDLYPVECRTRFSLDRNSGAATFGFVIHNREQVFEHALKAVRDRFAAETGLPVFIGSPPPPA